MNNTRTNTEDVKAESMVYRLVDQLVRHAVKPHMTCQGDSTSTLTLKRKEINAKHQVHAHQSLTMLCIDMQLY